MNRLDLKLLVNESPACVSVTWWGHGYGGVSGADVDVPGNRGVAEASFLGEWLINRVLVQGEGTRGRGIGGHLLETLKEAVVRQGGLSLWVQPGGYGSNPADQNRFYEAHGFVCRGEKGFVWEVTRDWLESKLEAG